MLSRQWTSGNIEFLLVRGQVIWKTLQNPTFPVIFFLNLFWFPQLISITWMDLKYLEQKKGLQQKINREKCLSYIFIQVPHATFPCPVVGYHKQITCKSVFNHRCYHVNGQIFVICLGKVLISKNHKSVSFIMPFLWIIIKIYDKHFSLLIFCW
jgi:hypothetical protein